MQQRIEETDKLRVHLANARLELEQERLLRLAVEQKLLELQTSVSTEAFTARTAEMQVLSEELIRTYGIEEHDSFDPTAGIITKAPPQTPEPRAPDVAATSGESSSGSSGSSRAHGSGSDAAASEACSGSDAATAPAQSGAGAPEQRGTGLARPSGRGI